MKCMTCLVSVSMIQSRMSVVTRNCLIYLERSSVILLEERVVFVTKTCDCTVVSLPACPARFIRLILTLLRVFSSDAYFLSLCSLVWRRWDPCFRAQCKSAIPRTKVCISHELAGRRKNTFWPTFILFETDVERIGLPRLLILRNLSPSEQGRPYSSARFFQSSRL